MKEFRKEPKMGNPPRKEHYRNRQEGSKTRNNVDNNNQRPKVFVKPEFKDGIYTEKNRGFLQKTEFIANSFTRFYKEKKMIDCSKMSPVQRNLALFTHAQAIAFAAESRIWSGLGTSKQAAMPRQRFTEDVRSYQCHKGFRKLEVIQGLPTCQNDGVRVYYRVIVDKEDKYILLACHVNVHGFHRGDLRFVEVNDQTIVMGFEEKSIIGNLLLGDIVAVTELRKTSNEPLNPPSALKVHQDSPCIWAVHKMTILRRTFHENVVFAFLGKQTAVAKGFDEMLTVKQAAPGLRLNQLFTGNVFIPEKVVCVFAQNSSARGALTSKSSAFSSHSSATGTITAFSPALLPTEMFNIGVNAFKFNRADAEEIVELCALMGYSAANTIFNGRSDCRTFRMMDVKKEDLVVRFSIPNPYKDPTEGRWEAGNRVTVNGTRRRSDQSVNLNAVVETVVTDDSKRQLHISARLSRTSPRDIDFKVGVFFVAQRESRESVVLAGGFFRRLICDSNGRRIIQTLYGKGSLSIEKSYIKEKFTFQGSPPIPLNEFQNEYISMLCSQKTPLVVASSPFGCGKSMTIVTAALKMFEEKHWLFKMGLFETEKKQLLITQSNYASVNLVEIARKCAKNVSDLRFVRFISDANWKELAENCQTEYDVPNLIRPFFAKFAQDDSSFMESWDRYEMLKTVVQFVIYENILKPDQLCCRAKRIYNSLKMGDDGKVEAPRNVRAAFFHFYQPHIIMTTADSLPGLFLSGVISQSEVATIQVDEASQVPEYTFLNLFAKFPNATFGLIGDTRQLPPYCEDELKGKLKEYGIGNTMERAINGKLFPQATLKYVYRCHPVTTQLLSDLFYDGELISGVTADQRNAFMKNRNDFWPNVDYPMIIIDNKEPGYKMGTSCGNKAEVLLVKQIVDDILKPRQPEKHEALDPKDLGVISFYSAQTSLLTEALRGSGVKCGTVDSFQGSEREVIIVCCTNERLSEFMQLSNRLNVAMSRARQATIIIGNLGGLKKANHWSTIVERAEQHGCIVDMNKYPFNLSQKSKKNVQLDEKKEPKIKEKVSINQKKTTKASNVDSLVQKIKEVTISKPRDPAEQLDAATGIGANAAQ